MFGQSSLCVVAVHFLIFNRLLLATKVCTSAKTVEVGQYKQKFTGWQLVKFSSPFKEVPIVVLQVASNAERQLYPRIRKITKESFEAAAISYLL